MADDLADIEAARHAVGSGRTGAGAGGGRAALTAAQRKRLAMHSFRWTKELQITDDDFAEADLVYGSAMISGPLKSGEGGKDAAIRDSDVIAGAGAMRALALYGLAPVDIDHFESAVPEEYEKKYGKGINDPYPPGFIVDAQAVEVEVPPNGRKAVAAEFLALVPNRHVYKMIGKHKFKGCSVVDAIRSMSCPKCSTDEKGHDEKECVCNYDGSAYIANTLVLDAVPNSNGTWVDVFDRTVFDSIGGAEESGGKDVDEKDDAVPHPKRNVLDRIRKHVAGIRHTAKKHVALEDYMTDGIWNKEKDGVAEFLTERGVGEDVIGPMAEYLFANPTALSQYQLEDMSIEDLAAWWNTIVNARDVEHRLHTLERRVAGLVSLKPNAKAMKVLNDAPFGLSEVNYGARSPEAQCVGCRWYTSYMDGDPAEGTAPAGRCTITSADVGGDNGCDAFAAFPGTGTGGEPEPEEPADDPEEDPEEPEGDQPEGGDDNPDDDEEMAKDEKDKDKKKGGQQEPVPATPSHNHNHKPRQFDAPRTVRDKARHTHPVIEANPNDAARVQHEHIDAEIQKLRAAIVQYERQLARMPQFGVGQNVNSVRTSLNAARVKLAELEKLKKTS